MDGRNANLCIEVFADCGRRFLSALFHVTKNPFHFLKEDLPMHTVIRSKMIVTVLFVVIGLFVGGLQAGDLNPPGPPTAGTMKPLDDIEPRVAVNAANTPGDPNNTFVISQPGSYYLTGNITSNFKHAILIDADDVTLDLMGYRLWSSYSKPLGNNEDFDGIHVTADHHNITLQNGTVASDRTVHLMLTYRGFRYGIHAETGSERIAIENVCVTDARDDGIYLQGKNQTVRNCRSLKNDGTGIHLYENSKAVDNTCCGNGGNGITLRDRGIALRNQCNENDSCGIVIWTDCIIRDNACCSNSSRGISGYASQNVIITGNMINDNGSYSEGTATIAGIYVGSHCVIKNNTVCNNARSSSSTGSLYGIYAVHSCVIMDNSVTDNGQYADAADEIGGILATDGSTVINNSVNSTGYHATGNAIYGIKVGQACTVSHNTCRSTGLIGTSGTIIGLCLDEYCLADHNTSYSTAGSNLQALANCVLDSNLAP